MTKQATTTSHRYVLKMLCILVLGFVSNSGIAQNWDTNPWPASWITHPTAPATEFTVVNFRRSFELTVLPDSLPVMVSADNRYQLFVNGRRVGEGPSRGDLAHWRYETYDLRPYIRTGKNVISAIVWNYGIDRPYSQESYRLGFLLQPKSSVLAALKTDEEWKTYHNQAYSPITGAGQRLGTYYVAGPQLRIDGRKMPWGWEDLRYDDKDWLPAIAITRGSPASGGTEIYWGLMEREIPMLPRQQLDQPIPVRIDELFVDQSKDAEKVPLNIVVPNSERRILFQFPQLVNAFHSYQFNRGKGAMIKVTYAESLVDENGSKGNRGEVDNKAIKGVYDIFILEGNKRTYNTPWFRTGRYLELMIKTADDTLFIEDILSEEFAYPFTPTASFTDPENTHRTNEIWQVGWQTARMCAQETYVDCPYYEQLQYVGDTRIQALISLYVSGDDRLMRKAIKVFDESRLTEGLTQSRYPSNVPQVIPPYSLSWVEMVGDYWMHRPDTAFVRERLEGVRSVLNWYDQQLLPNGLIGPTPYWNFVDWTPEWPWNNVRREGGVPDLEGGSTILSLQYVSALRTAAKLFAYFGDQSQANAYSYRADYIAETVTRLCWNAKREIFSDTPKGKSFSQHANVLALLTDLAPAAAPQIMLSGSEGIQAYRQDLLGKILSDESLTQVSEYFRFYLIQALYHTGRADLYVDQLKIWAAYLDQGFTTFPEKPGETRSDCHAWSASPNYDLLATLAGIRPANPGFSNVSIRPAKVDMDYTATVAHPAGKVVVRATTTGKDIFYDITLPEGVRGEFIFNAMQLPLNAGLNKVKAKLEQ